MQLLRDNLTLWTSDSTPDVCIVPAVSLTLLLVQEDPSARGEEQE